MNKEMILGRNGYHIPCLHTITGDENKVAIVIHGFGSSKESPTGMMLADALPAKGMGTLAFDFPAHGDSPVDGTMLTVKHCIDDLAAAEQRVIELAPDAELFYFGSSFGAYILLFYLAEREHRGAKAFLRSAAVEMPKLFHNKTEQEQNFLAEHGYLMVDRGYVRPLKLTKAFFEDLDHHDIFQMYKQGAAELAMVHGSEDETASPRAAERFAEKYGAELTMISGGDHRLARTGMPSRVLELTEAFFELSHF